MYKKLGYLAAGVVVGLVVTGYLVNKEIQEEKEKAEGTVTEGLFAAAGSADITRRASSRARRRLSNG